MATLDEQETTITMTRGDALVYIYTAWPAHIRRLDRDPRALRRDGEVGRSGNFTVPLAQWTPLSFKRRSSGAPKTAFTAANGRVSENKQD